MFQDHDCTGPIAFRCQQASHLGRGISIFRQNEQPRAGLQMGGKQTQGAAMQGQACHVFQRPAQMGGGQGKCAGRGQNRQGITPEGPPQGDPDAIAHGIAGCQDTDGPTPAGGQVRDGIAQRCTPGQPLRLMGSGDHGEVPIAPDQNLSPLNQGAASRGNRIQAILPNPYNG